MDVLMAAFHKWGSRGSINPQLTWQMEAEMEVLWWGPGDTSYDSVWIQILDTSISKSLKAVWACSKERNDHLGGKEWFHFTGSKRTMVPDGAFRIDTGVESMFSHWHYDGRLPEKVSKWRCLEKALVVLHILPKWELGALRKWLTFPPEPPPLPFQLKIWLGNGTLDSHGNFELTDNWDSVSFYTVSPKTLACQKSLWGNGEWRIDPHHTPSHLPSKETLTF